MVPIVKADIACYSKAKGKSKSWVNKYLTTPHPDGLDPSTQIEVQPNVASGVMSIRELYEYGIKNNTAVVIVGNRGTGKEWYGVPKLRTRGKNSGLILLN